MTKLLVRLCAPLLLLGLAAAPASAAQTFYASLMAGHVSADDWNRINGNIAAIIAPGTVASSRSSTEGYRAALGYRFSENAAVEVDYLRTGEFSISSDAATDVKYVLEAQHAGAYLVGFAPVSESTEFYGKFGVIHWQIDAQFTTLAGAPLASGTLSGNDLSFGLGFNYHLSSFLDLTFGYTRVQMNVTGGKLSLDEFLLGVNLGF